MYIEISVLENKNVDAAYERILEKVMNRRIREGNLNYLSFLQDTFSISRHELNKRMKKKESKSKHLGLIVEKMMDKNCPSDL